MDSGYLIILDALRRLESCLCAVLDGQSAGSERRVVGFTLRAAGSDLVGNTIDDLGRPVFNDLGGGPVFDDFNNGPIFDGEPFVDPVFDAAPDSDHAAVTMLKFANSARAIHDQANPDDLAAGPVFDTETNYNHVVVAVIECTESEFDAAFACSDKGPGDLSPAHTGAILGGDLLFNKEPEIEDAASFTNMYLIIGADIAPPATTVDTLCTCSTKFPYNSFNTYCFSMDTCADSVQRDHGELFIADSKQLIHVRGIVNPSLVEYRSVLSDSVAANGIETKFWDPGAAGCLGFMALSGSCAAFLWDPGSLESLQSIGFANFHLAHPHELHVDKFESKLWDPGLAEGSQFIELTGIGSDFQILLLQQKYGGTADMWVIALGYMCRECQFKTWKFSFLEEIAQVDSFSVSGNVEFLQSGLDHHVPPCAQWQSSICYGCSAVGSHSKTDLIGALLLQWDWHIRALVVVTSKVHMPWGFSWLATPDDSYTVGYNIVLEMLIGGIQSVTLGDGPRAHSLLLSAHDQKMAEFLELQAQDGIGLQGISFLDQSLSVKVVAGAAADDGLSLADVTTEAKHSSDFVGSIGVALSVCTWPGRLTYDHLGLKQMELGLGIHGEPGGEDGADYLANLFLNAGFQNGVIVIFMEAEEHIDEFEVFDVQPFVSRLLGMGDWPGKHIPPSHALDHNRALGQISEPTAFSGHEAHVQELAWIPLMNLLVSGSWDKTLRFPDPSCNAAVGQDMVNLMADDEDKEKYAQYLRRPYIEDNRKTSWCPAPGCKYAVAFIMSSGSYDVNCNCSYGFCLNCSEEALSSFAYDPSPCKWYEFDYSISAMEGKRSEQADQGEKHICSDEEYKVGSRNWAKPNDGQADWHPIDDILHWHNANRKELHDIVEETRRMQQSGDFSDISLSNERLQFITDEHVEEEHRFNNFGAAAYICGEAIALLESNWSMAGLVCLMDSENSGRIMEFSSIHCGCCKERPGLIRILSVGTCHPFMKKMLQSLLEKSPWLSGNAKRLGDKPPFKERGMSVATGCGPSMGRQAGRPNAGGDYKGRRQLTGGGWNKLSTETKLQTYPHLAVLPPHAASSVLPILYWFFQFLVI